MLLLRGAIWGVLGGLVGAALYALAEHRVGPEVAPAGVAVGLVVGLLARSVARPGVALAVVAALLACAGLAGGKLGAIYLEKANPVDMSEPFKATPELLISQIANDVKVEFAAAGRRVTPAARPDAVDAKLTEQYSPEVWAEAKKRWEALPEDERAERLAAYERDVNERHAIFRESELEIAKARAWKDTQEEFRRRLVPLDGLWFGLTALVAGVVAAVSLGKRSPARDDESTPPAE